MIVAFAIVCLFCALVPAILFAVNLRYYVAPPAVGANAHPAISVLIPARNEAAGIGDAVRAILASRDAGLEVIVMDDGSTDGTGALVEALAKEDSRVRLEHAPPLPEGWNGKQHACWALAQAASNPLLCFVDADVRLAPDCLARMASFLATSDSALVSGFPQQITGSFLEWLLLPLIHFVLLGFLPVARMRQDSDPAFAAGCGQFMMARREDYFRCGGHRNIRLTMHDGLRLPKLFREHGYRTDLADMTHLATCRMYTSASQVWSGLAKNATEGIAAPARIVPITGLLLLGQVMPCAMLLAGAILAVLIGFIMAGSSNGPATVTHPAQRAALVLLVSSAALCAWLPRILATRRFRQDWRSALLHPLGILTLLCLQWYALIRKVAGSPVTWRARTYAKPSDS
jgi:hypothetical protein